MSSNEKDSQPSKRVQDDDTNYPSTKVVIPAMLAIWLAFFVVALVGTQDRQPCIAHG
jgi:hypothetical protein